MDDQHFQFDDELNDDIVSIYGPQSDEEDHFQFDDEVDNVDILKKEEEEPELPKKVKKKRKFTFKPWYILIILAVLAVSLFAGAMYVMTKEDGPVYGERCAGLIPIGQDNITKTVNEMKKKYTNINTMSMEIACKTIKLDIDFKSSTKPEKAESTVKATIKYLDKLCKQPSYKGSEYSVLFNKSNNVNQYEVNVYLTCAKNKNYPIYGTKQATSDHYYYTTAAIKDKDTYKKVTKKKAS